MISDPDFFVNQYRGTAVPVWAICGVYHRERLDPGDMVFFLPVKERLEAKGIPSYICTGVLVVDEIVPDKKHLLRDPRFSASYKRSYAKDLRNHLKEDRKRSKPRTEKRRPLNIVLGHQAKSKWFGPNTIDFQNLLTTLGIGRIAQVLPRRNNRNLPTLTEPEMDRLYEYLSTHLTAITDISHEHPDGEPLRSCRSCVIRRA